MFKYHTGALLSQKHTVKTITSLQCLPCGEPYSTLRVLSGYTCFVMSNMGTQCHIIGSRILLRVSKSPLGPGLAFMDMSSADGVALHPADP
eukprot:1158011-Pelagomonas_calceolata.AAC.2